MTTPPLLELAGVSKGFGPAERRTPVLRDLTLSIADGEFTAIVGYSGAGKTTLLSLLAGLLKPDSGRALMNGTDIAGPGPDRAVVFQNYSLLPWLSVEGNVALAVDSVFAGRPAEWRRDQVRRHLDLVNLGPARAKKPHELSGGMRQRVSLARALAMDPRVLLMDEPLSALDALTRATLQDEIERIWGEQRKTVLLVTNDVDEGLLLADRILPLSAGPGATLGPAVAVDLPRPRKRETLKRDPAFAALRRQVLAYLLGPGARRRAPTREPAGVGV